jgi:DNA-binding LytR/AlgR family response regulator
VSGLALQSTRSHIAPTAGPAANAAQATRAFMTTAIIAEDEPLMRAQLTRKLAQVWPDLEILSEAENGAAALEAIDREAPDLIFLDIQMPGISGVEVARRVQGRCRVVFVTAYDEYAVAAFEQGAIDYLLKPVETERLAVTVERIKAQLDRPAPDLSVIVEQLAQVAVAAPPRLRWIKASIGANIRLISVSEIAYFQSDEKYTRVVTADAEALIRKPIKELIDELDPELFWQIHRSTLVNVNHIAGVGRDFRGQPEIQLSNRKEKLTVSRPFAHLFKQM